MNIILGFIFTVDRIYMKKFGKAEFTYISRILLVCLCLSQTLLLAFCFTFGMSLVSIARRREKTLHAIFWYRKTFWHHWMPKLLPIGKSGISSGIKFPPAFLYNTRIQTKTGLPDICEQGLTLQWHCITYDILFHTYTVAFYYSPKLH